MVHWWILKSRWEAHGEECFQNPAFGETRFSINMHFTNRTMSFVVWLYSFYQANTRRLDRFGDIAKPHTPEIKKDLKHLWESPSKSEFDIWTGGFVNKWEKILPEYTKYFQNTWMDRYPPYTWAFFGRPDGTPSGLLFCKQVEEDKLSYTNYDYR